MGLKVLRSDNGIFMENTYILLDQDQCLSAVVDPGTINDDLINAISSTGSLDMIILTHGNIRPCIPKQKLLHPPMKSTSLQIRSLTIPNLLQAKRLQ